MLIISRSLSPETISAIGATPLTIIRRSGLRRMAYIDHPVCEFSVGLFPNVIMASAFLGNAFAAREIVIYSPANHGSTSRIA